jgi:hypothetical protein
MGSRKLKEDAMKEQLTSEEKRAEAFRLVAEAKERMTPYQYELFLQRLEQRLNALPLIKSKTVNGGCTVLQPYRWANKP